jgi:hypothetical protein
MVGCGAFEKPLLLCVSRNHDLENVVISCFSSNAPTLLDASNLYTASGSKIERNGASFLRAECRLSRNIRTP